MPEGAMSSGEENDKVKKKPVVPGIPVKVMEALDQNLDM